jgi:hypothetical protein
MTGFVRRSFGAMEGHGVASGKASAVAEMPERPLTFPKVRGGPSTGFGFRLTSLRMTGFF